MGLFERRKGFSVDRLWASHNFIVESLVKKLQLSVLETSPYWVMVGDGYSVKDEGVFNRLQLTLQELSVNQNFYLFLLDGVNMDEPIKENEKAHLHYTILSGMTINVGGIISLKMLALATSTRATRLGFLALITTFCARKGVDIVDPPHLSFCPAITREYILIMVCSLTSLQTLTFNPPTNRARLHYTILSGMTIDVGDIISLEMLASATSTGATCLGFLALITTFCARQGMDILDSPHLSSRPTITRKCILTHCRKKKGGHDTAHNPYTFLSLPEQVQELCFDMFLYHQWYVSLSPVERNSILCATYADELFQRLQSALD
ncbi:hypothetical protein CR513_40739, partial [Mucuna pruriens]